MKERARLVGAKNLIKIEKNNSGSGQRRLFKSKNLLKHYKLHETKDKMLSYLTKKVTSQCVVLEHKNVICEHSNRCSQVFTLLKMRNL